MKNILIVLGIVLLVGVFAYPALSDGPGWGWGHHMRGYWDRDYRYGAMHDRGYGNLSDEERGKLEELDRKYDQESETIREQIVNKSQELDALMGAQNPDLERAKALQREISDLRADLDQKGLQYEFEARKIVPEQRLGGKYGRGYGRGYHRGFSGRGGAMGYGPGVCWR